MNQRHTSFTRGYVETPEGIELFVESAGSGDPIVFVHGLFGLTDHWAQQTPYFATSWRTVSYDLRGSGRSDKPLVEVYTIEEHVDDLEAVLDQLGVTDPVVLVGHSMGSCVVLQFALRHPARVRALVLVDGFACGEHCGVGLDALLEKISSKREMVRIFNDVSFGRRVALNPMVAELADQAAQEATKLPIEAVIASARGYDAFDARDRLGELRMPALVVVGDEDWSCALDPASQFLADGLVDAQLVVLQAGHFPIIEDATAFNEVLDHFLARLPVLTRS